MMKKTKKQGKENGAALILVVVVTVLLAVIGVMFLMVSRVSEMETVAVADQQDLDAAVQTVTGRINEVLVEDLFGLRRPTVNDEYTYDTSITNANEAAVGTNVFNIYADEPYDYPIHNVAPGVAGVIGSGPDGTFNDTANYDDVWLPGQFDDYWLASLEPVFNNNGTPANLTDDFYEWPHITDLWGSIQGTDNSLFYQQYNLNDHHKFFRQNLISKRWIDPDNINDRTTWDQAAEWNKWQISAYNVEAKIIAREDRMDVAAIIGTTVPTTWADAANETDVRLYGARADADGDGVADSRWVRIPGLNSSRGKAIYAAVRIIDNCAMLNLNGASCFDVRSYADSKKTAPFKEAWNYWDENPANTFTLLQWHNNQGAGTGRYLTEINYLPFLRGLDLNGASFEGGTSTAGDGWYNLMLAKGLYKNYAGLDYPFAPRISSPVFMNIENANNRYNFFDIGDELELRNRYLVTSPVESRFERADVANFTLDAGGGTYGSLRTPVDDSAAFLAWKIKVDPLNFDAWDSAGNPLPVTNPLYRYDRRHVCTFYSYDRNLRHGQYPVLDYDFLQLAASKSWTVDQIKVAQKVFWPMGAVSTNIENPDVAEPYNNIETRKRLLHLLFALRAYYLPDYFKGLTNAQLASLTAAQQEDLRQAAIKAAQIVANIIDYSDDDAGHPTSVGHQGPFYDTLYGDQANVDCTFITEQIIEDMVTEASGGLLPVGSIAFGLKKIPTPDIVFGYERQPFISEVYGKWNNSSGAFEGFAVELLNPYSDDIKPKPDATLTGWKLKIGDGTVVDEGISNNINDIIPKYDTTAKSPGRYVIRSSTTVSLAPQPAVDPLTPQTYEMASLGNLGSIFGSGNYEIQLLRPVPAKSGVSYIVVDRVPSSKVALLFVDGENALKRDDDQWHFLYDSYKEQHEKIAPPFTLTLGQRNEVTESVSEELQLAVADDGYPVSRRHDLEVMSLFGNGPDTGDPNDVVSVHITDAANAGDAVHLDLAGTSEDLLDFLCTINRPDEGTLPGRININTAPVHVIAAAIPPVLADPNAADSAKVVTFSALDLAQAIVNRRNTVGPYKKLSDLLKISRFKEYTTGGAWVDENVGAQSIENDIEERDWILSNLANKFTVRSDVFTAYVLVRLGEDGPQRRMIAIFDRSGVWKPDDRPKLVALHPVPDPR